MKDWTLTNGSGSGRWAPNCGQLRWLFLAPSLEWVTSIKITVMGQTTANYKPPCAEMSYDLCELGSEREGGSKTSLLNQWPVFEISKYRRTCQANLIRNAEQEWVQCSMKQTARSILLAACFDFCPSHTQNQATEVEAFCQLFFPGFCRLFLSKLPSRHLSPLGKRMSRSRDIPAGRALSSPFLRAAAWF